MCGCFYPGDNFIVEIDALTHFTRGINGNILRYRPTGVFYDNQLHRNGYQVVRVPYYEIDDLDGERLVAYIRNKINVKCAVEARAAEHA